MNYVFWVLALNKAGELSRPLRELWARGHDLNEPVDAAKRCLGNAVTATFFFGMAWAFALPSEIMVLFIFAGVAGMATIFFSWLSWRHRNAVNRFFTNLLAAWDILNLPFEQMAKLPVENLVAGAKRVLTEQGRKIRVQEKIAAQEQRLHEYRDELERQYEVFRALGLITTETKTHFLCQAIDELAAEEAALELAVGISMFPTEDFDETP